MTMTASTVEDLDQADLLAASQHHVAQVEDLLAARGEGLSWYVGGEPVAMDPVSGRAVWRPQTPGFYEVTVVDEAGRQAVSLVRINSG